MTGRPRRGAAISTWRRIETVTRQLELCALRAGEHVVVISTPDTDPALVDLLVVGIHRHGATATGLVIHLDAPGAHEHPLASGPAGAAVAVADLAVDLSGAAAAAVPVSDHTRLLSVDLATAGDLDRLVVHPGLARRVERTVELLGASGTLVLSSPMGTMLDVGLTDAGCTSDPGVAAAPGDRARWPGGIVWAAPRADIVNGTVVLMPGDEVVEVGHIIRSPVRLEIAGGRITDILGESADADHLRHVLETLEPDDTARVAAIGLGLAGTARARPGAPATERPLTAGRCSISLTGEDADPTATVTLCLDGTSMTADQVELVLVGELVGVVAPDVYELAAGD